MHPMRTVKLGRRAGVALTVAAVAAVPLAMASPAAAATTTSLLYSTDNGATWSANATVAPGASVPVRAWYDNSDAIARPGAQVSTSLPPGFTQVPGSTVVCLNPSTTNPAMPNYAEVVCNNTAGQGGAINEGAVWSWWTLGISPTAWLFGQSTGQTAGTLEIGKKRYINLHQCDFAFQGPGMQDNVTNVLAASPSSAVNPAWHAGTNTANTADAAAVCGGGTGQYQPNPGAGLNGAQALDLLGKRYLNLHQCDFAFQGPAMQDNLSNVSAVLALLGSQSCMACGHQHRQHCGRGRVCGGGTGQYQPNPGAGLNGAQALDLLGKRYLNLHQCDFAFQGPAMQDNLNNHLAASPTSAVNPAWYAGTNTANTADTAAVCGGGTGQYQPNPGAGLNGAQALDLLDTARGRGFVQFQMTAPNWCPAAKGTVYETETLTGAGFNAPASIASLTIAPTSCP